MTLEMTLEMTLKMISLFNLYSIILSSNIDEIFLNDMIKYNITNEDLEKLPEFTENNFKGIVRFCDYWQLKDDLFEKLKDQIVFKVIFNDKLHYLIEHIPSCLLKELETNNSCIMNRKCECNIENICGTYNDGNGSGHLYCLKYLFEVQHKEFTLTDVIDNASAFGHLEIIQYLLKKCDNLTLTNAVDLACRYGHLEVLRYLFKVQDKEMSELILINAIDLASFYGHLEVLLYLFEVQHNCSSRHLEAIHYLKNIKNDNILND